MRKDKGTACILPSNEDELLLISSDENPEEITDDTIFTARKIKGILIKREAWKYVVIVQ